MFGRKPTLGPDQYRCGCGEVYTLPCDPKCWRCGAVYWVMPRMTRAQWPAREACVRCRGTFTFRARRRAPLYCSAECRRAGHAEHLRTGTRYVGPGGYVYVLIDGRWRAEHTAVAERILGRPLTEMEHVRHRNGDRSDNDPANLVVWMKNSRLSNCLNKLEP